MAREPVTAEPHVLARCCWCSGPLYLVGDHYWCRTEACWRRQAMCGVKVQVGKKGAGAWLYVPTPKQVEFETAKAPYVLFGGAAGGSKSHGLRWSMYRRAMAIPGYEALLLRRTFPELEKTHLRKMATEIPMLARHGVDAEFIESKRIVRFGATGSLIECGHMDDAAAVDKYLSTEYDDIGPDEASLFDPQALLALSSRSVKRTKKPAVVAAGGPWFRPVTNPGGPAARVLLDFFIHHTPDFDKYPQLRTRYHPDEWQFIPAKLEDNPYLGQDYEDSLAVNDEVRFRQLRDGDWNAWAGQFFTSWRPEKDGRPYHVRDLEIRGDSVSWVRSMDWGRSNPGSVGWWACLPDGHYHRAAELKFIDRDIVDVAADIKGIDAELGVTHVRYTVSDPALFNKSQETGESIAESFGRCGIPLTRGNNNRVNGWERFRSFLRADPQGVPYLTSAPRCRYFNRTVPLMQQSKNNPEDLDTDSDDHAIDEARYFCMSRPAPHRFADRQLPPESVGSWADELREAAANA